MKEYVIKRIKGIPTEDDWKMADIAKINLKPWKEIEYHFNSFARLLYNDEAIYVCMATNEMPVITRHTERNSPVSRDSCMEFFFSPKINSHVYMNIEINALGTSFIAVGRNIEDRICCNDDEKQFDIKTELCQNGWKLSYKIPFAFIKKYFGELSSEIAGNFYKCGSRTGHSHFDVWNMIETQSPDFHRPEFFGRIVFENWQKT